MSAYYNEFDPKAAAWLRELIKRNLIAPGEVDERSIIDVQPDDLRGFTQCHFFAGIGVWSYALRNAGWADDRPVWTGSCPCQPFSTAGKGDEFADERHLWPAWFRLIRECRPVVVFGEQVASKDALSWIDHVRADLEGEGYALGCVDTCAAGFGAPHPRSRLYFVGCRFGTMEHADLSDKHERTPSRKQPVRDFGNAGACALEYAEGQQEGIPRFARQRRATGGFWADAHWIPCRGGKWRPIKPGSFPLAPRAPARMGRVRGYGNAINAEQAKAFIQAYREVTES